MYSSISKNENSFTLLTLWGGGVHFSDPLSASVRFQLSFLKFHFQVSIKTYHIQAILEITSPFQVESTPCYLLPLSPATDLVPSDPVPVLLLLSDLS